MNNIKMNNIKMNNIKMNFNYKKVFALSSFLVCILCIYVQIKNSVVEARKECNNFIILLIRRENNIIGYIANFICINKTVSEIIIIIYTKIIEYITHINLPFVLYGLLFL